MKKIVFAIAILFFVLFSKPIFAAEAEEISEYDISIWMNKNGSAIVREQIKMDFKNNLRHGIIRNIPYLYSRKDLKHNLRISDFIVKNEKGENIEFSKNKSDGIYILKIGDKNVRVSDKQTYVIEYKVDRVFDYFEEHDEFYYNAITIDWAFRIQSSKIAVYFPENVETKNLQIDCVVGSAGPIEKCDSAHVREHAYGQTNSVFFKHGLLEPGKGISILLGFKKGLVNKPRPVEQILYSIISYWYFVIPIIVLIVFIIFFRAKQRVDFQKKLSKSDFE